jgi:acetyl esterase
MTAGSSWPSLEPTTQQFIDSLAGEPLLQTFLPEEGRAMLIRVQSVPTRKPRAHTEDLDFPVGPTGSVPVRVIRPPNVVQALPIIMLFHGGGSILGDKDSHDRFMREIAVGVGAAVIFVGYDRVPKSRFPVAIEQAYAATKYAVDAAQTLNLDATRLAVLGDSVGGNIAAVVALLAKERRGPKIDLQVLLYPVTDADFGTGSYSRFANGPWSCPWWWCRRR